MCIEMTDVKANGIMTMSAAANGEAPSTKAMTMVGVPGGRRDGRTPARLESVDSSSSRMALSRSARSTRYEP